MKNYPSKVTASNSPTMIQGSCMALPLRNLTYDTLNKFGYTIGTYNDKIVEIASYRDTGNNVKFQKLRYDPKGFSALGNTENILYGQWLWKPSTAIAIVICEGEHDAHSIYQASNGKQPVVSIPFGVGDPKLQKDKCLSNQALAYNLEWLLQWKEVILAFDNDPAGQEALNQAVKLFPIDKLRIAKWTGKDANDLLKEHKIEEIKQIIWNASPYKPDWIVDKFTDEDLLTAIPKLADFKYPKLNNMIRGIKAGRLYLFTSGSGMGKSSLARELIYDWACNSDFNIGHLFLEEAAKESAQTYIAMDNNIPDHQFTENPQCISYESYLKSKQKLLDSNRIKFANYFGSLDSEDLINKLRTLIFYEKCSIIVLDHISMVVSGQTSSVAGERKDIDMLMTKLRTLIQETNVPVIAISHLKRSDGTSYNNGGQIELSDLRGSGSLEQLSDFVIGMEGNQFADDNKNDVRRLKVLKSRKGGFVGYADYLWYNRSTGRLELVK